MRNVGGVGKKSKWVGYFRHILGSGQGSSVVEHEVKSRLMVFMFMDQVELYWNQVVGLFESNLYL